MSTIARSRGGAGILAPLVIGGVVVLLLAGMTTTPRPETMAALPDAVVAQEAEDTTDAEDLQTTFEAQFGVKVGDLALTPEDAAWVDAAIAATAVMAFTAGETVALPGYGNVELNTHALEKHGEDADVVHREMIKGGFKKYRCKDGKDRLVKSLGNGLAAFMIVANGYEVTAFTMPTARAWHTLTRDNCIGGGGFRFAQ